MNYTSIIKKQRVRLKRKLNPLIYKFYFIRNSLYSTFQNKTVIAYWYPENNFGDQLTPDIIKYFGLIPLYFPQPDFCEIIGIGSILEIIPESYRGNILGTGYINKDTKKVFSDANIFLVRGKLTAEKLNLSDTIPLGDPGILMSEVYENIVVNTKKNFTIGLIPHYKHIDDPVIISFMAKYPNDICFIDVRRKPANVVRDIASCDYILSSSLHGIIAAHSLNIPSLLFELTSTPLKGGKFKFKDYYSVYNQEPFFWQLTGNETINELCNLAITIESSLVDKTKKDVCSAFKNYIHSQ